MPDLSVPLAPLGTLPDPLYPAVFLLDKPTDWTSFDVVKKLRGMLQVRKVGHAGTLDPMATGLLICCAGKATKQIDTFMGLPKTYIGTLRLGAVTTTYDADGEITAIHDATQISTEQIRAVMANFVGDITQIPPMYSAIKVRGERLYKKARRGETIERPPRHVHIETFDLVKHTATDVDFKVGCSKGTYVRSLAHDVGQALGVGAHLTALRRTAIGPYHVNQAWTLPALNTALNERRAS